MAWNKFHKFNFNYLIRGSVEKYLYLAIDNNLANCRFEFRLSLSLFLLSISFCLWRSLPGKSFAFVYFNQHKTKAKNEKQPTEVWQIVRDKRESWSGSKRERDREWDEGGSEKTKWLGNVISQTVCRAALFFGYSVRLQFRLLLTFPFPYSSPFPLPILTPVAIPWHAIFGCRWLRLAVQAKCPFQLSIVLSLKNTSPGKSCRKKQNRTEQNWTELGRKIIHANACQLTHAPPSSFPVTLCLSLSLQLFAAYLWAVDKTVCGSYFTVE